VSYCSLLHDFCSVPSLRALQVKGGGEPDPYFPDGRQFRPDGIRLNFQHPHSTSGATNTRYRCKAVGNHMCLISLAFREACLD